ncbi:hypothetical protein CDL15_Pgr022221 [Punica granatum]|uniref:Uncharacterized protein n=1 Tax=Punica granatum TaxID=22663 RepID=A0A218WNL0_PUNGR|nr:hypothetical protein CDL15_Pgr022221 [Punica granatum]
MELFPVATGFLILEGDNLHNLLPGVEFEIGGFLSGKQSLVLIVALIVLPSLHRQLEHPFLCMGKWSSSFGYCSSCKFLDQYIGRSQVRTEGEAHGLEWNPNGCRETQNMWDFELQVLVVCFILGTFNYASMVVMRYLMFEDAVESQITLNLPVVKLSSKVAIYTTLVNPI